METAVTCIALLGLLLVGLGFWVSLTRGQTGTNYGVEADPTDRLYKLVRAHANTAEYAPMFGLLMLVVGMGNPAVWVQWTMVVALVSRYLIVVGMIVGPSLDEVQPLRFAGAFGTYISGLVLVVALIIGA